MLYDEYRSKVMKLRSALERIKRFRVPIIAGLALIFAMIVALISVRGIISDVTPCPSDILYGETLGYQAKAVFTGVRYEYAVTGSDDWSENLPLRAGRYRVRAKAAGPFGAPRYGNVYEFTVSPREVDVLISQETVEYGELPGVTADLAYDDEIRCANFIFGDITQPNLTVVADEAHITVADARGFDVTDSYRFRPIGRTVGLLPRGLTVVVQDESRVYDGETLRADGYELAAGTSLAEGDKLIAEFDSGRTDAGVIENLPEIRIVKEDGRLDVTSCYRIEVIPGKLTVEKRPLYLTTDSSQKIYDGTPLVCEGYRVRASGTDSGLLSGHKLVASAFSQLIDVGTRENDMSFTVQDASGRDVTDNYSIVCDPGTLTVDPRPVTVTAESASWIYDAAEHRHAEYTIADGDGFSGLLQGHTSRIEGDTPSITDVGSKENWTEIRIFDGADTEVSGNYAIVYLPGRLTVSPRPVKLRTKSRTWVYDGREHFENELEISQDSEYSLADGHEARAARVTGITDSGTVANVPEDIAVCDAHGRDVTENYSISTENGLLTVQPRPITVAAGSAEKIYDGTPLTCTAFETYSAYGEGLVAGHTGVVITEGQQTDAGASDNSVLRFAAYDGDRDVTFNYQVFFASGLLTVQPRPVTVVTGGAEKVYDDTPLTCADYWISSSSGLGLVGRHRLEGKTFGSQTEAGRGENGFQGRISDGNRDVTFNYEISVECGMLSVLPRPIIVRTNSCSWMYDGRPHSDRGFALSGNSEYRLVQGHRAEVTAAPQMTDVGSEENRLTIGIFVSDSGRNVTANYEIALECGILEITPRPITVRAGSAEKIYDGLPFTTNEIYIFSDCVPALVEGHRSYHKIENSQLDVGTRECQVTFFVVYDEADRAVTDNYAVHYEPGTLTVTPRPLMLEAGSSREYYTGAPQFCSSILVQSESTGCGLLSWHIFSARTRGSLTDVGSAANVIVEDSIRITEEGRDVTFNYEILCFDGLITVLPRPICVTAGSAEKMFDGTPLTCDRYTVVPLEELTWGVVPGERIQVTLSGSQTQIGQSPNAVLKVQIQSELRDTTGNYDITTLPGLLTVQIPDGYLKIKTHGAEKVYDGTPLTCVEFEVENTLPAQYRVEIRCTGSITDVGETENDVEVKVFHAAGADVSDLIHVECERGLLRVLPRRIVIETASNSWPYDGRIHHDLRHWVAAESDYALAEGQFTWIETYTNIFDVGVKDNELSVSILTMDFNDVTDNYIIEYIWGLLEITESDYTGGSGSGSGGGSGSLDTSGGLGGGGDSSGGEAEQTAVKVYSEVGGKVYLRLMSFGDFDGRTWQNASSYLNFLDEKYCFNYMTGRALEQAGYESSLIRIESLGGDYLLPYYMAMGDYDYDIQTSDVWYRGDTREIYELRYYPYDYVSNGPVYVDQGSVGSAETDYRFFVRQNYLQVPGSTLAYLNMVIATQGWRTGEPGLVGKVAAYVQNAASYSLNYNRLLDTESDIVVSFLRDYREGVCRHYASAATLLYRALGIPARYTIGYAGEVTAGDWSEISAANAHAWVEVYIDGMGWVQVEVTGAGPAFGGAGGSMDGKPHELTIKPVDRVKQYDGQPLYADAVMGVGKDNYSFREFLNDGYTYRAEFSGSQTEVGESPSAISSFQFFDPDGKEVKNVRFYYDTGRLTVVSQAVVTVHPYSLQKYYDGTPLVYQDGDYYVTGLPEGYELKLNLGGLGLTNAGVVDVSQLQRLPVTILDDRGANATQQFYVNFDPADLLMVSRRRITLTGMSVTKVYDGMPLTCEEYWISSGSLVEGHRITVKMRATITDIGSIPNTIESVIITDERGVDVTKNYQIVIKEGLLTVVGS